MSLLLTMKFYSHEELAFIEGRLIHCLLSYWLPDYLLFAAVYYFFTYYTLYKYKCDSS